MENKNSNEEHDIIDKDLYEEIDDEEMLELVEQGRKEVLLREKEEKNKPSKSRFPKWVFWVIAIAMTFHVFALLPQTFSIPAIDFLITSAKLSTDADVKQYKKAVVVIGNEDSKGTGFSINEEGLILTNDHVVAGADEVTVAFPDEGLFVGRVIEKYPDIDIAVVQVENDEQKSFPYLTIDENPTFTQDEHIYFIGNPLQFTGIANEGTVINYTEVSSKELPVLMLDAPVYRGNSGSPVINDEGNVIGVVFATLHHDVEGRVGLFIPMQYYVEYAN